MYYTGIIIIQASNFLFLYCSQASCNSTGIDPRERIGWSPNATHNEIYSFVIFNIQLQEGESSKFSIMHTPGKLGQHFVILTPIYPT